MKINRSQLRRIIVNETRRLVEGNWYEEVGTDRLIPAEELGDVQIHITLRYVTWDDIEKKILENNSNDEILKSKLKGERGRYQALNFIMNNMKNTYDTFFKDYGLTDIRIPGGIGKSQTATTADGQNTIVYNYEGPLKDEVKLGLEDFTSEFNEKLNELGFKNGLAVSKIVDLKS